MKSLALLATLALVSGAAFAWRVEGANATVSAGTTSPGAVAAPRDVAAELAAANARIRELETLVVRLRAELGAAEDRRIEREREFLQYTEGIARLASLGGGGATLPPFRSSLDVEPPKILDVPPPAIETELAAVRERIAADDAARETARREALRAASRPEASAETVDPLVERSRAIFHGLRALFAIEQVTSLDLLETGRLQAGFTGPVVLRVLDERGRPLGSISAERLRLEASRAARMVTIVLEQGYERRAGQTTPFDGGEPDAAGRAGVRRIVLPDCDPRPWLESIPELFAPEDLDRSIDDGRHDLEALRATLNQLLRDAANAGGYRVRGIGGVLGDELREVTIEVLDREGRVDRRLYADRASVLRAASGIQLLLEGGSQIRGDRKAPFLDGRFRIFLPRASAEAWERAGVPGIAPIAPTPVEGAPATDKDASKTESGAGAATSSPAPDARAPSATPPTAPAPNPGTAANPETAPNPGTTPNGASPIPRRP